MSARAFILLTALLLTALALLTPAATFAQPASAPVTVRGPVSVAFDGGVASGFPGAGPAVGGRVSFDLNERFAIEAAGSWFGHGGGADGGTVTASWLVNLTGSARRVIPYAAVGGGFYRAMFDMGNQRFFGAMGSQYAGSQMVPIAGMHGVGIMQGYAGSGMWTGPWSGPTWDLNEMPTFYLRRMGALQVPADGRWGMRSFTDPAISLGGGVRIDVTPHLYVRPDVRALIAIADGNSHTTGLFTFGLGYRF